MAHCKIPGAEVVRAAGLWSDPALGAKILGGATITFPAQISQTTPVHGLPRARGSAVLTARVDRNRSVIGDLRQQGSMKLLFPRCATPDLDAVLINTAGGVTNGDQFTFTAGVDAGAALSVTTQAAERAYRASGPDPARIRTELSVGEGATLRWMPQETILFDGCAVDRSLRVNLAAGATALVVETLVFGRAAMGETLKHADFRDRIEMRRGRTPVFLDLFHLNGDVQDMLNRPFTLNGAGAMSTLVLAGPTAEAALAPLREALPETGGASLIEPDLLVARLLAPDSFLLRQSLLPILATLTGGRVPRPWMI